MQFGKTTSILTAKEKPEEGSKSAEWFRVVLSIVVIILAGVLYYFAFKAQDGREVFTGAASGLTGIVLGHWFKG